MEMDCIKSVARLLDINLVNKEGFDLSNEVLWVNVGQRAAVLRAVKVGGKKNFANQPSAGSNRHHRQTFF